MKGSPTAWAARCRLPSARCRWTQARQLSPPSSSPIHGMEQIRLSPNSFPQPTTVFDDRKRHAAAVRAGLELLRPALVRRTGICADVRYIGTKGTRLPRMIEANPAVYGPGATADNADRRRIYAGCQGTTGPCDFGSVGLITNSTNSTYHAAQASLTRRYSNGLSFLVSYTYSKSLDYVSTFNVSGSAPGLVAGENDLAQNPFDLQAEHGPSAIRTRATASMFSGLYRSPSRPTRPAAERGQLLPIGSSMPSRTSRLARRSPSMTAPMFALRAARRKSPVSIPAVPTS